MFDKRCADTIFLVEATDFERHCLWRENEQLRTLYPHLYLDWRRDSMGQAATIGYIGNRPICACFFWVVLDGYRVCFYYATSQLVDHAMLEEFVKHNFPNAYWDNGTRWAHCDAFNFHRCRDAIKEHKKKGPVKCR